MHLRLERDAPISEQDRFNSCIRPSEWALMHSKEALDGRRKRRRVDSSGCLYNGVLGQISSHFSSDIREHAT